MRENVGLRFWSVGLFSVWPVNDDSGPASTWENLQYFCCPYVFGDVGVDDSFPGRGGTQTSERPKLQAKITSRHSLAQPHQRSYCAYKSIHSSINIILLLLLKHDARKKSILRIENRWFYI